MQVETSKGISKSRICFLSLLSIIIMAAAVSMLVLLIIWGYIGFDGSQPIVLGTCTSYYSLTKYSNLRLIFKVIFITSLIAAFCSFLVFIIMLVWTVRKCKDDSQATHQVNRCTRNFMYFLISLMVLASLIPVGYCISFIIEMDSCNPTKNNSQLLILLIIASCVFAFSFLLWIMLGCSLCDYNSEDKYRQGKNSQIQSKEQKQQKKSDENLPIKRYNPRIIKHEQTKENIFESSPIKHPYRQQNKYKDDRHQIEDFQPKNTAEIQNLMNQNIPLKTKYETPVANLHPSLRPKRKWLNQNNQKYIPTIKQPLYERNQSQNERSRAYNIRSDQQSLKREEKRYLSRPEGGILPSSGVRKKDYKHYRNDEGDEREMSRSDQRRHRDRYSPDRVDKGRGQSRYRDDRQEERNHKQQYREIQQNRVRNEDKYEDDRQNNSRRSPPRQNRYQEQRSARGKEDYRNYRDRYGRDDYMGAIDPSHQDTPPRRRVRD